MVAEMPDFHPVVQCLLGADDRASFLCQSQGATNAGNLTAVPMLFVKRESEIRPTYKEPFNVNV